MNDLINNFYLTILNLNLPKDFSSDNLFKVSLKDAILAVGHDEVKELTELFNAILSNKYHIPICDLKFLHPVTIDTCTLNCFFLDFDDNFYYLMTKDRLILIPSSEANKRIFTRIPYIGEFDDLFAEMLKNQLAREEYLNKGSRPYIFHPTKPTNDVYYVESINPIYKNLNYYVIELSLHDNYILTAIQNIFPQNF